MANTRITMGEQACLDAIISGTITEFEDDSIGHLRGYAFAGCGQLRRVDLPRCTKLAYETFHYCSALEAVNLPSVEDIGGAVFAGCTSLRSISLPSLRAMGSQDQFWGCTNLVTVQIGPSFATSSLAFGFHAFANCTSLVSLTLETPGLLHHVSDMLTNTPIARGEGTIYVPAAYVEEYRADAFWGQYPIAAITG